MGHYERGIPVKAALNIFPVGNADWKEELGALGAVNHASFYSQGAEGWSLEHDHDIIAGVDRRGRIYSARYLWKAIFVCNNLTIPMDVYVTEYGHTIQLQFGGCNTGAAPAVAAAVSNGTAGGTLLPASICPYQEVWGCFPGSNDASEGLTGSVVVASTGVIAFYNGIPGTLWAAAPPGTRVMIRPFTFTYDTMKA
jgi:hypothetical protein